MAGVASSPEEFMFSTSVASHVPQAATLKVAGCPSFLQKIGQTVTIAFAKLTLHSSCFWCYHPAIDRMEKSTEHINPKIEARYGQSSYH